jgi:TolB protein
MAPNSQPDIYLFTIGSTKKLTNFSGIDVGGKFADNEQNIVFVSNRLGTPNIFKMPISGGNVSQIVHHGTNNASVDANGNQVVYSSKEGPGSFNIYLTDTSGSQTRPLTSGGINQFPRFSRDGNIVMYIKRTGSGNSIGFINLSANRSEVFNMGISKIQSIDW